MLMLHYKIHGISSLSAAESFINITNRTYIERGSLFIMKGTQANEIHSAFFQLNEIAYDFFNSYSVEYPVDGFFSDHSAQISCNGLSFVLSEEL